MPLPQTPSTLETYGGALTDYSPVVDPTTDRPASAANQAYADCAMMTGTAIKAWVKFNRNDSATFTISDHYAVWGGTQAVAPVITYSSTGIYLVTFPATVTDPLNVTKSVNLKVGWAVLETGGLCWAEKTSPNSFTVNTIISGNGYHDFNGYNITLFVV